MAISTIELARLIDNARQQFQTAVNINVDIPNNGKYDDNAQKLVADSINAVNKGFIDILNTLVAISKVDEPQNAPAPVEEAPVDAPQAPAEVKDEEPAAQQ